MAITFFGVKKGLLVGDPTDTTKELQLELNSAATTGTKTTLIASQTANRTLTIPDATDTLVGKATTDILTNKTLTGNTAVNLISGAGTLILNTSGTVTLPNATDTLVGKATTDILTNKTIDGDDNTVQDLSLASLKTVLADANKFLVRDGSGIVVSNTKDVPTGTVVGTSDTQVLTNKDIDGGVASNTNRITVPKDTLVNLTALTRKQATIVYDTTNNALLVDDGSTLNSIGGVNTTLSNLTSPTAINQDLLPSPDDTRDLGSRTQRWNEIYGKEIIANVGFPRLKMTSSPLSGPGTTISGTGSQTFYLQTYQDAASSAHDLYIFGHNTGLAVPSPFVSIQSGNHNANSGSQNSGKVHLKTGDLTNAGNAGNSGDVDIITGGGLGSGSSGAINLTTGSFPGGRGNINLSGTMVRRSDAAVSAFIEQQYFDGITLLAGQTNTVITDLTFAHASYQGFEMLYKVKEAVSNDTRVARFIVATEGTNVSYADAGTETASTGITFDAVVSGANIQIRYSSGANGATLRSDVTRIRA